MKPRLPRSLALGQAGVHRVCAELLLREIPCYVPLVDIGVDVQLGDGRRLQVKATRLRGVRNRGQNPTAPSLGPAYRFSMSRQFTCNYNQGSWRRNTTSRPFILRKYSDETDFVVLWGVDEDRFWVVPASIFDHRQGLVLYPGRRVPCVRSGSDVAAFASVVHQYEGRWDLLDPAEPQQEETPLRVVGES